MQSECHISLLAIPSRLQCASRVAARRFAGFDRRGIMLRIVTCLALLMSLHAAEAQDRTPGAAAQPYLGGSTPPTDLPSGIDSYCIYDNLIYSIGSPMCVGKTSYVCAPATNEAELSQRAYWSARPADPKLTAPVCQ